MISKGNHVKFAGFLLLAVSEEALKNMTSIFFVQCIIKLLLDSDFVIPRIIEVSVRVITKTLSNNCLLCQFFFSFLSTRYITLKHP